MEYSATANMSRSQVEAQLTDTGSALYGYRYTTRAETQALFESYTGAHSLSTTQGTFTQYAPGMGAMFADFGVLDSFSISPSVATHQIADGDSTYFDWNGQFNSYFFYGDNSECDNASSTCLGWMYGYALDGTVTAYEVNKAWGRDATSVAQNWNVNDPYYLPAASLLIRDTTVSAVPVPAAIWLFSSGLLAMVGFAGRKRTNTGL